MLGFDALARLALAELPKAAQTVVLTADSGVYTISGQAAAFRSYHAAMSGLYQVAGHDAHLVGAAATGSYTVTGSAAILRTRFECGPGQYTVTGSDVAFKSALAAASGVYSITGSGAGLTGHVDTGSYAVTGSDVTFGARFIAQAGSYTVTLGDFELRRTGYDYPPDQYGIGHIKLEMVEARRRARVVKPTPYPVVRHLPALSASQVAPMRIAPVQGLIDNSEIIDRLRAAEQAQAEQQQAAERMQARNRAITALLLAA